jgi:hypothetical protein
MGPRAPAGDLVGRGDSRGRGSHARADECRPRAPAPWWARDCSQPTTDRIPGIGAFDFPAGGPPLPATQGTADTVNPPGLTRAFFTAARRPKYLLSLIGAEHLPPYSAQQPQLAIVERVTVTFFDAYLKHRPGALRRLLTRGRVAGISSLLAAP